MKRQNREPSYYEYLKALRKMKMLPTRYPDLKLLRDLGIEEDVNLILDNIGLKNLLHSRPLTYPDCTLQFLASANMKKIQVGDEEQWELHFMVKSKKYSININKISDIFGFPCGQDGRRPRLIKKNRKQLREELSELWLRIGSSDKFEAGLTKSSFIRNPALRYVHKVLAHSFFARKDISRIFEDELLLMIEGIRPFIDFDGLIGIGDMHIGGMLAERLADYKNIAIKKNWSKEPQGGFRKQKNKEPQLSIGGMVTPILQSFNIDLGTPLQNNMFIDRVNIHKKFFLAKYNKEFVYEFVSQTLGTCYLKLPNTSLTSIKIPHNLMFYIPTEHLFNPTRQQLTLPDNLSGSSSGGDPPMPTQESHTLPDHLSSSSTGGEIPMLTQESLPALIARVDELQQKVAIYERGVLMLEEGIAKLP